MRASTLLNTISAGVILAGIGGTFILCHVLVERERVQLRRHARFEAEHIAGQISLGVESRMARMEKLGAWWLTQGKPLNKEEWQTDAQLFLSGDIGLREVIWLDGAAVQRWSVRPGSLPEIEHVKAPKRLEKLVRSARSQWELALSQVFELPDGTAAVYGCVPLITEGRVRGYVAGLYSVSELLASVLAGGLPGDFEISVDAAGRSLYVRREAGHSECADCGHRVDVPVANARWTALVAPSARDITVLRRLLLAAGLCMTALLYMSAVTGQISRRRAAELERMNGALQAEIAERERAEAKVEELNRDLQRRLTDFETLIEVIPIGIAVSEEPVGKRIWINPALAEMLGSPRPVRRTTFASAAHDKGYRFWREGSRLTAGELPLQVAARTATAVRGDELQLVRPDGTEVDTLSYAAPLFDEAGGVRGVLLACVDISERKRSERERRDLLERERAAHREAERSYRALRASEARFQRLIESDVIGIVISSSTRIVDANQFFLDSLGYSRSELHDSCIDWQAITPEEYRDEDGRRFAALRSTGKLEAFEKELLRKDGRRMPVLIGGALIEAGAEWIVFVLDLTERKDLEQRLARAEKVKSLGKMAAGISHDFNNLLTTILGNVSFALEQTPAGDPLQPFLSAAIEASYRAADLVSHILAYSGGACFQFQPIGLAGVLRGMLPSLKRSAPAARMEMHIEDNLPAIRADESELRRVITHVVTNAVESLGGGTGVIELRTGLVRLSAECIAANYPDQNLLPGPYVRLGVMDNGCGMTAEVMSKIFDPFFTTKFTGRGLGLSAVQGIIRAHHGGIRVESSVASGTRFELLFPAVEEPAPAN